VHHQRHHTRTAVERAVAGAGLVLARVFGQLPDGSLSSDGSEEMHHKLVYLARRKATKGGETT
jgi:hypothetical protein